MQTLNLGIVAHVDAGKTSLTERLLFTTGVLDELGSVDAGSTLTDSSALERARGITIRSAVASFVVNGVSVNLIDTPGHPDFIAEVDRVLGVLDGAVLVLSAVEGVQPQTRILMRALQRLRVPTVLFVNKIDRAGARYAGVMDELVSRLSPHVIAMGAVSEIGSASAVFTAFGMSHPDFGTKLVELLTETDESLLRAYVEDEASVTVERLCASLRANTQQAQIFPVFFGSAITGAGIAALLSGLTALLPSSHGDSSDPVSGTVFKMGRGPGGEAVAYVRMWSGTLHVRDRVKVGGRELRVTGVNVFDHGSIQPTDCVGAGQIATVRGWGAARIGDTVGTSHATEVRSTLHFAPPTLETVVRPVRSTDKGAMYAALSQLAEQDPLIALRANDVDGVAVSLYGEVQKEVLQATLAGEYAVDVTFTPTTTICVERVLGTGQAVELIGVGDNPFLATVGLRIEPALVGSGVEFRLDVELGSLPLSFITAVDETVHRTLERGLRGWRVLDAVVTMTHSGYWARQSHSHGSFDKSMSSTAGDFRSLTQAVLNDSLRQAGTQVQEPIHRFELEIPPDSYGGILPVLAMLRAVPQRPHVSGAAYLLEGTIPAASVHELQQRLPGLTGGEGVLESTIDHFRTVTGPAPVRIWPGC